MKQMLSGLLAVLLLFFGLSGAGREGKEPAPPAPEGPPEETVLQSRYEGMETGSALIRTKSGDAAFMNPRADSGFWFSDHLGEPMEKLRREAVPNTVSDAQTLAAAGVTALQINAHLCGVAVEPAGGKDFELSTVGRSNGMTITVESRADGGVLTLTCTGTIPEAAYVNPNPDFRVNTVRLGVPEGILRKINTDCGTASILVSGLDVPVRGVETNGVTCVEGKTRTSPVELHSGNGGVTVRVEDMRGAVALSAENGGVFLSGGTITGRAELSAYNGSVRVEAERLDDARLEAYNGTVEAEVGAVGRNVYAGVKNGDLDFTLTQAPENLTLRLSGGWKPNAGNGRWEDGEWVDGSEPDGLPSGWYDGYTVGNGEPVLELSAASNGGLNLWLGKKALDFSG